MWDKVKARQGEMEARISGEGGRIEVRRRPRYLFSGLLKCGSMQADGLFGCFGEQGFRLRLANFQDLADYVASTR